MAARAPKPEQPSVAEVRELIAALIVERSELLKAGEQAEAEAIGLAIGYWQAVLSKALSAGGVPPTDARRCSGSAR